MFRTYLKRVLFLSRCMLIHHYIINFKLLTIVRHQYMIIYPQVFELFKYILVPLKIIRFIAFI